MTRFSTIVAFLIVCTSYVRSDVCLWSVSPGGSATITGNNVRIDAAGTYKLEAVETCGSSTTLANIGEITINSSVTGTVTVSIESRANNNTPGAVDVGEINLTNAAGVLGNLAELRITGELGISGATIVNNLGGGDIDFASTSNEIRVKNNLTGSISAPQ